MKICVKCKKEMTCNRNGVVAIWNGNHCYIGDEYKCKSCDNTVLVTNPKPFYQEHAIGAFEYVLEMN